MVVLKIYMNNFTIHGDTFEENLNKLKYILEQFKINNLFISH